jgi:hypothetical protein
LYLGALFGLLCIITQPSREATNNQSPRFASNL